MNYSGGNQNSGLDIPKGTYGVQGNSTGQFGDADLQTLRNYVRGQAPCQATLGCF
jgi:hypothetical protein